MKTTKRNPPKSAAWVRYKDADDIFWAMDEQLKPLGFELVMYVTGDDNYVWTITKTRGSI